MNLDFHWNQRGTWNLLEDKAEREARVMAFRGKRRFHYDDYIVFVHEENSNGVFIERLSIEELHLFFKGKASKRRKGKLRRDTSAQTLPKQ